MINVIHLHQELMHGELLPDFAGAGSLSETAGVPKKCTLGALVLKSFGIYDCSLLKPLLKLTGNHMGLFQIWRHSI